jgi:hypothetical protein
VWNVYLEILSFYPGEKIYHLQPSQLPFKVNFRSDLWITDLVVCLFLHFKVSFGLYCTKVSLSQVILWDVTLSNRKASYLMRILNLWGLSFRHPRFIKKTPVLNLKLYFLHPFITTVSQDLATKTKAMNIWLNHMTQHLSF